MQPHINDTGHVSKKPANRRTQNPKNGQITGLLFLTMKASQNSPFSTQRLGPEPQNDDCFDDNTYDSLSDSMLRSPSSFSWSEQLEPFASLVKLCLDEDVIKVFVQGHRPFYAADCSSALSTPGVLRRKTNKVRYIKEDQNYQIPPVMVASDPERSSICSTKILTKVEKEDVLVSKPGQTTRTICQFLNLKDSIFVGTCRPMLLGFRNKTSSELTVTPFQGRGEANLSLDGRRGGRGEAGGGLGLSESPMIKMNLALATVSKISANSFILCHEAMRNKRRNLQFFCNPKLVTNWVRCISENIINSNYRLAAVFNRASSGTTGKSPRTQTQTQTQSHMQTRTHSSPIIYITIAFIDQSPRLLVINQTHLKMFLPNISNVLSDTPFLAFQLEELTWNFPALGSGEWTETRRQSFSGSTDSESFQSSSSFEAYFTAKTTDRKFFMTLTFCCESDLSHWQVAIETVTKLAEKQRSPTSSTRKTGYKTASSCSPTYHEF